ncbi:unnamed protein product [Orchesella dallaii]|uniref:Uncharacterized protein n=1 Tax=Orchesella dallaii TaxID=48710 RepID=A0ABP1R301_9HEXA
MKSFRCLQSCVNKNILNAGTNLFWCFVIAVIFVPLESECNSGGGGYKKDKVVSSEVTIQSNSLSFDITGKNQVTPANNSTVKKEPERKLSASKNKSTNSTKVSQPKRQDIVYTFTSTFRPVPTSTKSPQKNVLSSPSPIEMDLSYSSKEDENISASSSKEDSSESSSESPQSKETSHPHPQSKSAVPSLLFISTLGTMGTSTMKSIQYFKTPSSAVLVTSSKKSTTKRPIRITTPRPPKKKRPPPSRNVIYHKGKRKPKPGRKTTTTTSTSTTTPDPEEYDYEQWSSENSSGESNSSSTNSLKNSSSTTNTKMPLSKLAMAMIHTSSGFNNSGAGDKIYFPKTPVNLLNILQAYTKQIADNTPEGNQRPIVQIPNTPFMLNLNQLNFAAKVGISFYYSLIAIIPLVYLAFGGIGRLGIFDAIVGRRIGRRKRRRKRSNEEQFYYGNGYNGNFPVSVLRSDYDSDEYAWIIGRISEIIIEMSLSPDSEMESND